MTVKELCKVCGFEMINGEDLPDRVVNGIYACDLLSWVIGRAAENAALLTVMSNMNVVAVTVMADLSCVIFSENVNPDEMALKKAKENEVFLLKSDKPTYETAIIISESLKNEK